MKSRMVKCLFWILMLAHPLGRVEAQLTDSAKIKYLGANYTVLNDSTAVDCFENYPVVFIGEFHFSNGNEDLFINLFKNWLRDTTSNHIVILEGSYSEEKLLNEYLKTGEETYLDYFRVNYDSQSAERYKRMRDLWLLQPEGRKFWVKGVDLEYDILTTLTELMPPDHPPDKKLTTLYQLAKAYYNFKIKDRQILSLIRKIKKQAEQKKDLFKAYLGKNHWEFMHQLEGSIIDFESPYIDTTEDVKDMERREQYMYENYKRIIEKNPNTKFFAQFGDSHIPIYPQHKWEAFIDWRPLASRLNTNEDSPVKGKVWSAVQYYSSFSAEEDSLWGYEPVIEKTDVPYFYQYSTTPLTLFKINGENTPFIEMTTRFQYIIINRY